MRQTLCKQYEDHKDVINKKIPKYAGHGINGGVLGQFMMVCFFNYNMFGMIWLLLKQFYFIIMKGLII